MTRRDRLDRIKALWQMLLDNADSKGYISIEKLDELRAIFMLQHGISKLTINGYFAILRDVHAWRWNDVEIEQWKNICSAKHYQAQHGSYDGYEQFCDEHPEPGPQIILNQEYRMLDDLT